jgi:hypothetical protein
MFPVTHRPSRNSGCYLYPLHSRPLHRRSPTVEKFVANCQVAVLGPRHSDTAVIGTTKTRVLRTLRPGPIRFRGLINTYEISGFSYGREASNRKLFIPFVRRIYRRRAHPAVLSGLRVGLF